MQELLAKSQVLRTETLEKIVAALTEKQKAQWKQAVSNSFKHNPKTDIGEMNCFFTCGVGAGHCFSTVLTGTPLPISHRLRPVRSPDHDVQNVVCPIHQGVVSNPSSAAQELAMTSLRQRMIDKIIQHEIKGETITAYFAT